MTRNDEDRQGLDGKNEHLLTMKLSILTRFATLTRVAISRATGITWSYDPQKSTPHPSPSNYTPSTTSTPWVTNSNLLEDTDSEWRVIYLHFLTGVRRSVQIGWGGNRGNDEWDTHFKGENKWYIIYIYCLSSKIDDYYTPTTNTPSLLPSLPPPLPPRPHPQNKSRRQQKRNPLRQNQQKPLSRLHPPPHPPHPPSPPPLQNLHLPRLHQLVQILPLPRLPLRPQFPPLPIHPRILPPLPLRINPLQPQNPKPSFPLQPLQIRIH